MVKTHKTQQKPAQVIKTEVTTNDVLFELMNPNYRETTVFISEDGKHTATSLKKGNTLVIHIDDKWIHDGAQLRRKILGIKWKTPTFH